MKYDVMLAETPSRPKGMMKDTDFIADEKYDGHRALWQGPNLWSRYGQQRIDDIPELAGIYRTGVILDGEIYLSGGYSSDVSSHANRPDLDYIAFDILEIEGIKLLNAPYEQRRAILEAFVAEIAHPKLKVSQVSEDPQELLDIVSAKGGEGIILKHKKSPYVPGKRSKYWMKIKQYGVCKVVITSANAPPTKWTVTPGNYGTDGVYYPEGKPSSTTEAGHIGLKYGFLVNKELVEIGQLGVTGPRHVMEKLVGQIAEVKYYGINTETLALRHPNFLRYVKATVLQCTPPTEMVRPLKKYQPQY